MAGRKRHSAEDIVRNFAEPTSLTAEGKNGEEIVAALEVSAAALYNWRRQYFGMDANAAKELSSQAESRMIRVVGGNKR